MEQAGSESEDIQVTNEGLMRMMIAIATLEAEAEDREQEPDPDQAYDLAREDRLTGCGPDWDR